MIEVAKRLQDGAKFGELAEKFSEDKATSANGGKCDAMTRGTMDKCYAMTAFGLNVGQVSAVVATRDGYEIIRLLGKKTGDKPENDSVLTARIVRHYTNDEKQRAQIESLIRSGSIDLAFRDDAMREFAPAQFK
jgi:parvulin-like peptidyl-prolyl isomerase